MPRNSFKNIKGETNCSDPSEQPSNDSPNPIIMPSRSPPSTPHSDVNHPHLVYYGPLTESPTQSIVTIPDSPLAAHIDKSTQTSTKHIIVQNVSIQTIPNPPLTLQQKEPPNLPILLQLRDLLKDPKLFTPIIAHCEVHSPILNPYKSFHQTINLKPYQNIESIKIPIQSGIIHTLYQLNALPFFLALKEAPTKHGKRNFCTQCYHLGHYQEDCPFCQCPYCRIMRPRHNKNQCLDNPKYSGPNPIKQESPSPPPLQVLTPKTVKKPCFSPNRQSSTSSSSSNGIKKRGCKGKKPEWKRFQNNVDRSLSRQFWEMDEKYDQELKDFSIASDYQEQYNNTAYDNINGELSYSQDF